MSAPVPNRLWRILRSRRLAVALICILVVYTIVATLVPRGAATDPKVVTWAALHPVANAVLSPLGFHKAFASPLFLAIAFMLTACTSACAVERTQRALRLMRATGAPSEQLTNRLRDRPQFSVALARHVDPNHALSVATAGLRGLGLRVHEVGPRADGQSGRMGLLGSPLFHWSIVAVMLVVAAGQASRAEGFLPLPVGERVPDVRASYLQVTEGPLFGGRYSGLDFTAKSLNRDFEEGGVARGATPFIVASRAGLEVASGYVYANNPLRVGSLMVHMADFGPTATLSLESTGGAEVARETFLLDRTTESSSGTKPAEFALTTQPGGPAVSVRVQVQTRRASSETTVQPPSSVLLQLAEDDSGTYKAPVAVVVGDAVGLPGGQRLRVVGVDDWVRVSVANDWSVPLVYLAFIAAIAALALAVLVPTRRATLLVVDDGETRAFHVSAWHSAKDPTFKERVREVVRAAAGAEEASASEH